MILATAHLSTMELNDICMVAFRAPKSDGMKKFKASAFFKYKGIICLISLQFHFP